MSTNMKWIAAVSLGVGVFSGLYWIGREEQRRQEAIAKVAEESMGLEAYLKELAEMKAAIDAKWETAQFWNIVTSEE